MTRRDRAVLLPGLIGVGAAVTLTWLLWSEDAVGGALLGGALAVTVVSWMWTARTHDPAPDDRRSARWRGAEPALLLAAAGAFGWGLVDGHDTGPMLAAAAVTGWSMVRLRHVPLRQPAVDPDGPQ